MIVEELYNLMEKKSDTHWSFTVYEDDNGRLYFDTNFGRGKLDLHTGAYRDEFEDICGEPDRRVTEKVMLVVNYD